MIESNQTKCKVCNLMKPRILAGKMDEKNKKFIDDTGKMWSGRTCPGCHKERMKTNMSKMRFDRKQEVSPDVEEKN